MFYILLDVKARHVIFAATDHKKVKDQFLQYVKTYPEIEFSVIKCEKLYFNKVEEKSNSTT